MAKAPVFLARFDRRAEFVVARAFTARGAKQAAGRPFDKALVNERTLRCLYEQRYIAPADGTKRQRYTPGRGYGTIHAPRINPIPVANGVPIGWQPPSDPDPYGEAKDGPGTQDAADPLPDSGPPQENAPAANLGQNRPVLVPLTVCKRDAGKKRWEVFAGDEKVAGPFMTLAEANDHVAVLRRNQ